MSSMAEVSFHQFSEDDHDLFIENDFLIEDVTTHDSFRCWSHTPPSDCEFSPRRIAIDDDEDEIFGPNLISAPSIGSDTTDNILFEDRKNQVNFVMDLFHQRVEQSNIVGSDEIVLETVVESNLGAIEENHDVGVNDLDLELRLGLGLGLEDDENEEEVSNCGGFVVTDCGDEFYIARRESGNGSGSKNADENEMPSSSSRVGSLMVVGVDSDSEDDDENELLFHVHSEEEEFGVDNVNDDDLSIPLCWDAFQLEEEDDHVRNYNYDFEWEEVDDRAVDAEAMSSTADLGLIISGPEEDGVGEREIDEHGHLRWEVLLANNYIGRDSEMMENEIDIDDQDDIFNAAEYEMMFGQFAESENAFSGRPPASKSAVEKLISVITTEEDVRNEKALCAVCKDQIEVGKEGKQLPCSHRYHDDCIIPWLGIRNTCPVCRYELPTDNQDYEQRRVRRAARSA